MIDDDIVIISATLAYITFASLIVLPIDSLHS